MSEPERPETPAPPSFQQNPFFTSNLSRLSDLARGLTSGDFFNPRGSLGFLSQAVTLNPEITQQAIDLASRGTIRTRDLAQQNIINQLEANNQLTSSVAVNRLADLNEQFSQDISGINTNFFLADVNRALSNTLNLFGTGLDLTQNSAQLGFNAQQAQNNFNLANYPNQVAFAESEAQNNGRGGLFGGLAGTAIGGFFGGPFGAALGGSLGSGIGEVFSPSQTGNVSAGFGAGALQLLGNQGFQSQTQPFDIRSHRSRVGTGISFGGGFGGFGGP